MTTAHTPTPMKDAAAHMAFKAKDVPEEYPDVIYHYQNAELACNAHDALVAALEANQAILNALTLCPNFTAPTEVCDAIIDQASKNRAALAAAKAGA